MQQQGWKTHACIAVLGLQQQMQQHKKSLYHSLRSYSLSLLVLHVLCVLEGIASRFAEGVLLAEVDCFGCVQMQQYSQLEGLRQVACSRSGLDAVSRAEAELHGLSAHLPGHPQEVCALTPQAYLVVHFHASLLHCLLCSDMLAYHQCLPACPCASLSSVFCSCKCSPYYRAHLVLA